MMIICRHIHWQGESQGGYRPLRSLFDPVVPQYLHVCAFCERSFRTDRITKGEGGGVDLFREWPFLHNVSQRRGPAEVIRQVEESSLLAERLLHVQAEETSIRMLRTRHLGSAPST